MKLDIHLVPYALVHGQIPAVEKALGAVEFHLQDKRGPFARDRFGSDANDNFSRPIPTGDVSIRVMRGGETLGYLHVEEIEPHEERVLTWKLEPQPLP